MVLTLAPSVAVERATPFLRAFNDIQKELDVPAPEKLGVLLCESLREMTANVFGPPPTLRLAVRLPDAVPGHGRDVALAFAIHEYGHLVAHALAMKRASYRHFTQKERLRYQLFQHAGTAPPSDESPYHAHGRVAQELFADALAVLYFRDGEILSKHLDPGMLKDHQIRPRDFTAEVKTTDSHDVYSVSHVARRWVWRAYQQHGDDHRNAILNHLHDALYDELESLSTSGATVPWDDATLFATRLRKRLAERPLFQDIL